MENDYLQRLLLKQRTPFSIQLMQTIVFQLLPQAIGFQREAKNLLINYMNYQSLDIKTIMNCMLKKLQKRHLNRDRK